MRLNPFSASWKINPAPLTPAEIKHGMRITLAEGTISTAFSQLIGATFFNAFAIMLGANAHQLGLLASLLPLATVLQLVLPWLQNRIAPRRKLLLALVIPDRVLWWSVILIPCGLPRHCWMPALIGILFFRSILAQLDGLVYQDWLADLIPVGRRNSYWGLRYTLSGPVSIVIPFVAGWLLDKYPGLAGFKILYLIALPLMITDILLFLYQDEPPRQAKRQTGWKNLLHTLELKNFQRYLIFFGAWTVLQGAMTPYTNYLVFKVHHLSYTFVSELTVLSTMTSTVLYVFWGRMQDRSGAFAVYRFVLPLLAAVNLLWAFVNPARYRLYIVLFLLSGAVNAATLVGNFNLLLSVVPLQNRFSFLTVNSVALGLAGFVAPNLGAFGIDFLASLKQVPLLAQFSPFQQLFLLGSFGSLLLACAFPKLVTPLPRVSE